jgi:hypothetical protein
MFVLEIVFILIINRVFAILIIIIIYLYSHYIYQTKPEMIIPQRQNTTGYYSIYESAGAIRGA